MPLTPFNEANGMDFTRKDGVGSRPLVIIVEDDSGVRRSLQLLLQGRGYDVRAYASASALLADPLVLSGDCLLADYRLTATNGIAVLGGLRTRGWTGPAILISAFGSDELAANAKSAGFVEVLEKPFKNHALVNAVERGLHPRQSGVGRSPG